MAELSHRGLRELIEDFGGCGLYVTEMISAGALLAKGPFEAWYLDAGPCPDRVIYQLTGADPEQLARAAALLDCRGCAGIDLNMGCSAPAITRTGAGVRWMASIDRAGALIRLVRRRITRPLSVKLRIGGEDDLEYLVSFCRRLEEEGVEFITLHPRTAKEKFKRRARWEYVAALRAALGIPVAGNGDIDSAQELIRRAAGPWDAVMVGRGAVRQPWIFAAARNLESGCPPLCPGAGIDLEATGIRFLELLSRCQPPEFHLSRARRFFSYFCDNLKWGTYMKTRLNREQSLAGIERAWRGYFQENGD
jgi:tRNA-dihydrouridine synthase